ncbi:hypothetical protein GCM10010412_051000 [Nonomuraea recticatena]|uniref:CU044_5270 family protein n=1 Tax=Nonomuraea recticatena TaxID=46178 RepID=A0ABP6EMG2_9ACTN
MNEMTQLERFRSEIPRPGLDDLRGQQDRLLAAIADPTPAGPARRPRVPGRLRLGLAAGLVAVAASAAAVAAITAWPSAPTVIHTMPASAEEVLTTAARRVDEFPELRPKPGQFLVFESRTMDPAEVNDAAGHHRYLSRSERKVWLPVEGDSTGGFIESQALEPRPYPGWPIPSHAVASPGRSGPEKLADFDQRAEYLRTDYAYLSRLPTQPEQMYRHLYTGLGSGPEADAEAWNRVGDMLAEAYLPRAQRAALFRAAAAIRGVTTVDSAVDAAGRTGVAAARTNPGLGIQEEYIFDPSTYRYLGRRSVVSDAAAAQAPLGTVLTSSALLKVTVAGQAPEVAGQ